jgi:hypothetical protein
MLFILLLLVIIWVLLKVLAELVWPRSKPSTLNHRITSQNVIRVRLTVSTGSDVSIHVPEAPTCEGWRVL